MTTDRDASIERLLRQPLPPDFQAPEHECPDAETLAALADDTLTAAARRDVEGHLADCGRCQATIAAMVRAEVPAHDAAAVVPAWSRRWFNWFVPAAAAATAVALWVLIPGQQTPAPEAPLSEQQARTSEPQAVTPAPPPLESVVITEEPLRLPSEMRADGAAPERNANVAQERALEKAAPAPPAAAAPPAGFEALRTAPTAAADQAARRQESTAQPQAQLGAATGTRAAIDATTSLRRAGAAFDVVSPDPRVRWQVGPGPVIQYSADGGMTWVGQPTGATAALTAGSSPTPDVLWLVGRGGLVLRTTNGGRQWERVAFPEPVDLTAVTATTALAATVTLADARRLSTTDGGRTWAPAR